MVRWFSVEHVVDLRVHFARADGDVFLDRFLKLQLLVLQLGRGSGCGCASVSSALGLQARGGDEQLRRAGALHIRKPRIVDSPRRRCRRCRHRLIGFGVDNRWLPDFWLGRFGRRRSSARGLECRRPARALRLPRRSMRGFRLGRWRRTRGGAGGRSDSSAREPATPRTPKRPRQRMR